jgi:hypothetical protein
MDVEEEVFEGFFSKLESAGISPRMIAKLKKLRETNELNIPEKIEQLCIEESMSAKNKGN